MNFGAYYLVGIPVAVALGFWMRMRGRGLWMGVMVGVLMQSVILCIITCFTNWEEEVCFRRCILTVIKGFIMLF